MAIPEFFEPVLFASEIIYTILAVLFCFAIYFKTRESYELTKYEGIKYFRYAFLYFGLSYLLRFLLSFVFFSRVALDIILPRLLLFPFSILLLGYLSTIAILYLIYSSIWKKAREKHLAPLLHIIAIILAIASFLSRSHVMLLYLQSLLLFIVLILSFVAHKKISKIKILYVLISVIWLINLWIIDNRRIRFEIDIFSQIISLIVFSIMYHKITKWVK